MFQERVWNEQWIPLLHVPEGLGRFASYFDKAEEKAKMFSIILEAFKHYKET
jgi:hypothetical protein